MYSPSSAKVPRRRTARSWPCFDGDKLKSLEVPNDLPTENDFVTAINTFKPTGPAPKLSLSEAERQKLPTPPKAAAQPVQEATGAVRHLPAAGAALVDGRSAKDPYCHCRGLGPHGPHAARSGPAIP